ncbi:hypothetical protein [Arcobacter sp. LA11]|uniref:hypothetical protein n=1 Tax=Arcobacter sp. LA11 TaxID=1898176 RepID=UPI0009322566|nr:hypothetical protein [Arcobacter sp. LA11]
MTEKEKRKKIIELVNELLTYEATEERESEIFLEIDKLSPDLYWSDYIYWAKGKYHNSDGSLNMEKFLDKIFSYKPIILPYRK